MGEDKPLVDEMRNKQGQNDDHYVIDIIISFLSGHHNYLDQIK